MSPLRSSQDAIVDAAQAVVLEVGAAHMTLDAVAAKAGVSKGGLLYHFPTKKALLRAMLDRRIQGLEEARQQKRAQLPAGPTREITAYVLSLLDQDRKTKRISAGLLASAAHDLKLLEPLRKDYRKLVTDLAPSGLRFERAAVIVLAAHGLRFLEILSLSPLEQRQRRQVIEEMLRLAGEEVSIGGKNDPEGKRRGLSRGSHGVSPSSLGVFASPRGAEDKEGL
jgi:AcrR family transcriptional regulator